MNKALYPRDDIFMCQEKKEAEESPALNIVSMHR